MLLEGGTFLGQGTYGCVFFPSVPCHNREDKKKKYQKGVSKVFKYDYQMREELDESKKITKLDRDGKYTNKALGSCALDPMKIDMDDSEQCKHTRVSPSNSAPEFMHQIIYEHKGIDLKHAMRRPYSITSMFDHVLNLMRGVQLLGSKKYAHMDLKPDNILITDSNKALLIDFGLGRSFKDLYDMEQSDYLLEYNYQWYAPEMGLYADIKNGDFTDDDYTKQFIRRAYRQYRGAHGKQELKETIPLFLSEFWSKAYSSKIKSGDKVSKYFATNFAQKADVFALGMVMFMIHKNAERDAHFEKVGAEFKDIVDKAIQVNPYKRSTIDEMIAEFEALMLTAQLNQMDLNKDRMSVSPPKSSAPQSNKVITSSSHNKQLNDCMQHKKPELLKMVTKYDLPKKLKQLKKRDLCEKLVPHIQKDITSYKTAQMPSAHTPSVKKGVTKEDCMQYYTLKELKEEVTKQNLPRRFKQLNKPELCDAIHSHLQKKSADKTVKRGKKKGGPQ